MNDPFHSSPTMPTISKFAIKLGSQLFSDSKEAEQFLLAVQKGESKRTVRLIAGNLAKTAASQDLPPFAPDFVSDVGGYSSGAVEGHHYQCDLSSAFMAAPLVGLHFDRAPLVLDLCASPGGKSVFASLALNPRMLISNETIGKRLAALISNVKRCQISPVLVTNHDPSTLKCLEGSCDLVMVDAPCSGQALVARGEGTPGAFHPAQVKACAMRQRRIISQALALVRKGGYLCYMTCTFSIEENEGLVKWALKHNPEFSAVEIETLASFRSQHCDFPAYRLFPHYGLGSGGFTVLLKSNSALENENREQAPLDYSQLRIAWKKDT